MARKLASGSHSFSLLFNEIWARNSCVPSSVIVTRMRLHGQEPSHPGFYPSDVTTDGVKWDPILWPIIIHM